MTERADQFAALYAEDRFGDQREWYHQRRVEAEKARDQTIHAKWVFSTMAAMAGSVAAAVPDWRTGLAIAAAFLAATAASLTAFQTLFAFPRLAKLYKDAEMSLMALDAAGAAFRPGLSQAETRSLVERVEKVFLQENGQWGQLIQGSQPATARLPAKHGLRGDRDDSGKVGQGEDQLQPGQISWSETPKISSHRADPLSNTSSDKPPLMRRAVAAGAACVVAAGSGVATVVAGAVPSLSLAVSLGVFAITIVTFEGAVTVSERRSHARARKPAAGSWGHATDGTVEKADIRTHPGLSNEESEAAGDGNRGYGADGRGNGESDEGASERRVWPRLSCPDIVVAGTAFDLYAGLAGEEDSGHRVTGRFRVPVEEFELGIEIEAIGFAILRGTRRFTMRVSPDDPFPVRALRLEPIEDPGFRDRSIEALFTVGGELRGYAVRDVTVVATPDDAAARKHRHPHADDKPARPAIPLSAAGEVPPDLTIVIRKDPQQPTTLTWTAASPYVQMPLTPELPRSDPGDPAGFLGEIVQQISVAPVEEGFETLCGMGQFISENIPMEIQDIIRRVGSLRDPAAPTILLATVDPYIPWELAVLEPPIGTAGGHSPFLGAQAAIGRWPLPKQPPPPQVAPQSVAVRDRAVITGSYVGVVGATQLPEAEEEARRLLDAWPGAKRIPATWREVIDCLGGDPPADVLHFALHGKFDQTGRQEGIFLIGKQPGKDDQYRVEMLTPYQVRNASLGGRAPLVFLNACQVGAAREVLGDYAGMALAFLRAGASAVIAPLWSIDDGAAKTLALSFYKSASGADAKPPAEILREERARLDRNSVRER